MISGFSTKSPCITRDEDKRDKSDRFFFDRRLKYRQYHRPIVLPSLFWLNRDGTSQARVLGKSHWEGGGMTYSRENGARAREEIASPAKRVGESESFDIPTYTKQIHMAEAELAAFISAVAELFGTEQSQTSTEDWLEEAELMDSPPRSAFRNWRSVTIAASARLASRIDAARHRQKSLTA